MPEMNERQIMQSLRSLGNLEVDLNASNQTLEGIRSRFPSHRPHFGPTQWMRRTILPGSIAAAAVVLLVWIHLSAEPATAEEQLRHVGQATREYRGWIHEASKINAATAADTQAAEPIGAEVHCNTANGDWVDVLRFKDRWQATMRSPQARQQAVYQSDTNTLTITSVDPKVALHWTIMAQQAPWTIDTALDALKQHRLDKGLIVNRRIDGEMDRFDITFPKDDPHAAAAQRRSELPLKATVWADAHTGLIRRVDIATKETHVDGQITYGPPAIKDLYDIGVPLTAKVVKAASATRAGIADLSPEWEVPDHQASRLAVAPKGHSSTNSPRPTDPNSSSIPSPRPPR